MLSAVLFDLDNTLVDRDEAFREALREAIPDPTARAELGRLDEHGHGDRARLLAAWARHANRPAMTKDDLGRLIAEHLRPDHGLLQALQLLSSSLRLGIVTNGGGETQRRKLRAAGLDTVIPRERIWISGEVGTAKPDPAIFWMASRALSVPPAHCLHIGDHGPHDLAGATAAGMRACLVDAVLNAERLSALLREEGVS